MGAARWTGVLAVGLLAAATAVFAMARALAPGVVEFPEVVKGLANVSKLVVGLAAVAPLLAAIAGAAIAATAQQLAGAPAAPAREKSAAAPGPRAGEEALALLALLQQSGRFVDFLEEDLAPYSDAQVGSAVRSIHEGCRTVLHDRLAIAPILAGEEGATVTVEAGFDPAAVRLTGNVRGGPPYRGVLRHAGWRSSAPTLPERTGDRDATILAPAEVEVS
jgi:hypothetical protein